MKRLVYSPKVQAWINGTEGVVDVSPYIVSGMINRKVNQVSTAQLTLRNPVSQGIHYTGTLFTDFPRTDGTIGPLFHPMDPIIITMQRIQGHPIQVFTGYLDKSPYVQLFPGLCTIEASCTLKRLLYTQFDAALPFVTYFLSLFGWVPDGNSGIMNPTAETDKLKLFAGQIQNHFNDGSFGGLIAAVMMYIGQWDHSTIFIEGLPDSIKTYVVNLFNRIEVDVGSDESIFQNLIEQILGSSALGGGGSSTTTGQASGPVQGAKQIVQHVAPIATKYNVPLRMVLAVMYIETGFSNKDSPGNLAHTGWFQAQNQETGGGHPYAYGPWSTTVPTTAQTHDLGTATDAFCAAAAGWANADPSLRNNIQLWGEKVQGVTGTVGIGQKNSSYTTAWANALATADSYISQFGNSTGIGTGTGSTAPNPASTTGGAVPADTSGHMHGGAATTISGTSPGGKQGNATTNSLAGYVNPFTKGTPTSSRVDQGVDYGGSFDVRAIGDAHVYTADATGTGWPGGGFIAYTLKSGAYSGQNVYVAENVTPLISANKDVKAGQVIGRATGGGIETGWADPGGQNDTWFSSQTGIDWFTYDSSKHKGLPDYSTAAGRDFNNFITSLGAPSGTVGPPLPVPNDKYTGVQSAPGTTGANTGGSTVTSAAGAAAFSTMFDLPSVFQTAEAVAFTGKRSFIADSPLFPFIEQLCQASMRNFMSMPNGNFFAFFPDYFGLFGRNYYWSIKDIEIMDLRIDLSDDPLTTHIAVAGDVTQFSGTVNVFDLLLTAGIFDIFDAFALGYVSGPDTLATQDLRLPDMTTKAAPNSKRSGDKNLALAFLQRYGARTLVEEIPAIRSPFFELFYSFQKFMLLWSKQFQTTCELTFMPELFPGGLVALEEHNIQLYVEEVTHTFDYTQGFTTVANFSSPASLDGNKRNNLHEGLTRLPNVPKAISPLDLTLKGSTKKS